jgi:predicted ABC-type sugar transport system permease subunit
MTFMGVNTFQQNIVTGAIFIAVVGLGQYQLRRRGKDYE